MYKPITTEFRTAFTRVFSFFTHHVRRRPWGRGCVNECFYDFMFVNRAPPPGKFSSTALLQSLAKSLLHNYYCTIRRLFVLFVNYSRTIRTIRRLFVDYSYHSSTIRGLFALFVDYSRTICTIRRLFALFVSLF
jgi:hypothetical protein